MSKELIERLRSNFPTTQAQWEAADRIEELERTVEFQKKAWTADLAERNALQADNARLREFCEFAWRDIPMNEYAFERLESLLSATTEQSLARIRNQVREDIAREFDGEVWAYDYREIAARIRAMKEPE